MPEQVVDAPVKPAPQAPIKMGVPLSQQAGALTRLLQSDAPIKPEKPVETPKEEPKGEEPVTPDAPVVPSPSEEPDPRGVEQIVELPPVGKYILDKLPQLSVRIKDGETVKIVNFKDVSELPAGFELADDSARAQFTVDVANQVARAKDALNEYKQTELNNNIAKFQTQEAKDVARDLASLQKAGIIPAFTKKETDPDFNDDEGVKIANAIYDIFKKRNNEYARTYANSPSTYRMSYRDAANEYFANEARAARKAADDSQKAKDQPKEVKKVKTPAQKEREQVAKQQGAPAGGEPTDNKPKVRSGMTMADINKLVNLGRI